jgi:hypothetical protein
MKPETMKPETMKPETMKPETMKPETMKPETMKPETMKPLRPCASALKNVQRSKKRAGTPVPIRRGIAHGAY